MKMPKTIYIFLATIFVNSVSAFGTVHRFLPRAHTGHIQNHHKHSKDQLLTQGYQRGGSLNAVKFNSVLSIRGGGVPINTDLVNDAFGWCANLGAPAALVAGELILPSIFD